MKKCILFLLLIMGIASSATAQVKPTDTDGNGYLNISTLDHIRWISENPRSWGNNFELDNNINAATTAKWNLKAGFSPIGNITNPFTGKFDGNGFAIDSLYIRQSDSDYLGFFGYTIKAEISNIGITNSNVIGNNYIGALVGKNDTSTVRNCFSTGKISGTRNVGGLLGVNTYTKIINCFSRCIVSGTTNIGGLDGADDYYTMVCNSYSSGSVSGSENIGGIVGYSLFCSISNSYSISSITGKINTGGLAGISYTSTENKCFWDKETSGIDTSAGGTGKTTAEMKTKSTFTDAEWNFDLVWAIDPTVNTGYPYINERGITLSGIEPSDNDGDGARNIYCYSNLHWISQHDSSWSWNYELDNNINADTTRLLSGDIGFTPIGSYAIDFSGKFEGNGFSIDNLYINTPLTSNIGLFGSIMQAEILNIGIKNCQVIGEEKVGGLVGKTYDSKVNNCYSSGNVSGTSLVGGLVGQNFYRAKISSSYSTCNVSGIREIGGLVGNNESASITESYSTGNVSGGGKVGGLVGNNFNSASSNNNYSTGNVSGKYNVGGLVGVNGNTSTIVNCYSIGNVSGTSLVGGLVGKHENASAVVNCYSIGSVSGTSLVGGLIGNKEEAPVLKSFWDTQTSGIDTSAGGASKTTAEMKTKSTFSDSKWNFDLVWALASDKNNGYPFIYSRGITYSGIEPKDTDGDGYRNINCYAHLHWVSLHFASWAWNYELDNNINADSTKLLAGDIGFTPIGDGSDCFSGKFKGNGFVIDNLYINRSGCNMIGFFGMTKEAEISNIGITNCSITGYNYVGGLVGANTDASTIINSYISGNISGSSAVGGIVGWNRFSRVGNSYSSGSISGNYTIGGFVGLNDRSTVKNCYSMGNVSGSNIVGGLVGVNYYSSLVNNCYSTCSLSGSDTLKGLIGSNYSFVYNSFWNTQTSGISNSEGGAGKTTAEMKTKSTFTNADWNFDLIWAIASDINNGYPYINDRGIADFPGIEPIDTDGDGYRNISCYSHLHWISKNYTAMTWNYELDNDINADTTRMFSLDFGFDPIGDSYREFKGKFKGNSFAINNLYINRINSDDLGLFGMTSGATISNLGVTNCRIIGQDNIGGLIGALLDSSTISKCYSTGSISGNYIVGGFVGRNAASTVSNCYSTVKASGNTIVGGFIGSSDNSKVSNCYSTGNVAGKDSVGGFVGVANNSTASNSFWDIQTSGITNSVAGTGKTTTEMQTLSTFTSAGWDFSLIWVIESNINNGCPYIKDRGMAFSGIEPIDTDGDGYRNVSCYSHLHWISRNSQSWAWKYKLENNINADSTKLFISSIKFTPIGNIATCFTGTFEGNGFAIDKLYINDPESDNVGFFGRANEAKISNIAITNCQVIGKDSVGGLFGSCVQTKLVNCYSTGTISGNAAIGGLIGANIASPLTNCYSTGTISGYAGIGGLIGANFSSSISNCYSTETVSGSAAIGGLIGVNYASIVTTCYSKGKISGEYSIGGLIGVNDSSAVSNCYSTAEVSGKDDAAGYEVGGLIGNNFQSSVSKSYCTGIVSGISSVGGFLGMNDTSTVSNCYSTGKVSGNMYVGGFLGVNLTAKVTNCYCIGKVSGNDNVGGFLGINLESSVSNSFWDTQTSGIDTSAGGFGKTTAEMKTISTFTNTGWDFNTIWSLEVDYNNGYPNLKGMNGSSVKSINPSGCIVYPQPSANELAVKLNETSQAPALIQIFDQNGMLALSMQIPANEQLVKLSTAGLSGGIYQMTININGKMYSQKVIVVR